MKDGRLPIAYVISEFAKGRKEVTTHVRWRNEVYRNGVKIIKKSSGREKWSICNVNKRAFPPKHQEIEVKRKRMTFATSDTKRKATTVGRGGEESALPTARIQRSMLEREEFGWKRTRTPKVKQAKIFAKQSLTSTT